MTRSHFRRSAPPTRNSHWPAVGGALILVASLLVGCQEQTFYVNDGQLSIQLVSDHDEVLEGSLTLDAPLDGAILGAGDFRCDADSLQGAWSYVHRTGASPGAFLWDKMTGYSEASLRHGSTQELYACGQTEAFDVPSGTSRLMLIAELPDPESKGEILGSDSGGDQSYDILGELRLEELDEDGGVVTEWAVTLDSWSFTQHITERYEEGQISWTGAFEEISTNWSMGFPVDVELSWSFANRLNLDEPIAPSPSPTW